MMERALIICLFLTSLFGMVNHANAQSLCEEGRGYINNPAPGYNVSSNMGIRNLDDVLPPGTRYSRNHPGTDYSAACGTRIPGPPPGCALSGSTSVQGNPKSGRGNQLFFDCGKNEAGQSIRLHYSHLQTSSFNTNDNLITIGNTGSGGCHLDYIISVNGQTIDAQCATGSASPNNYKYGNSSTPHGARCPITGRPNLCDENVVNQLLEHGRQARSGRQDAPNVPAGSGGAAPAPPDGPTRAPTAPTAGYPTSGAQQPPTRPRGSTGNYDRDVEAARAPYVFPTQESTVCQNSTCISTQIVKIADHKNVQKDEILTNFRNIIHFDEIGCMPPISTGKVVLRQRAGRTATYQDRFCTTNGCSFIFISEEQKEAGEIECQ